MGGSSSLRARHRSGRAALAAVVALLSLTFAACEPPVPGDHDLRVSVIGPPSRVGIGSNHTLNIYLNNDGTATAPHARLAIIVPDTMSIAPTAGCTAPLPFGTAAASYIVCSTGDLGAGAFRQTVLTVTGVSASPALDLTILAQSDQPDDPEGSPNSVALPIEVRAPWFDLAPEPTEVLGTLTVGTPVTRHVQLKNLGPLDAPTFTYSGTWSANVAISSATAFGYINGQFAMPTCTVGGQTLSCTVPAGLGRYTMNAEEIVLNVTLTPTAAGAVSVTHTLASAQPEVDDPTPNVVVQNGTVVAP
jgi:hypothetical protein